MMKNLLTKLKNVSRVKFIIVLVVLLLAVTISFPTLARFKNRIDIEHVLTTLGAWDGTVATSYKKGDGTKDNPYLISNANEFAFFLQELTTSTYKGKYVKLDKDIVINNGIFKYENTTSSYTLGDKTVYLKPYTNELYETQELTSSPLSTINQLSSINNFEGYFDGDYNSIYGLYMTSEEQDLALFKNLSGTVENLYLENTFIYGGANTASLAANTSNATVKDIFVNGYVVGTKDDYSEVQVFELEDLEFTKEESNYTATVDLPQVNINNYTNIKLKGTYTSTNEDEVLLLNEEEIPHGDFELDFGTEVRYSIMLRVNNSVSSTINLTNLVYEVTYNTSYASGILGRVSNSNVKNLINKANVEGNNTSGLISVLEKTNLENAYNTGMIKGTNAAGLIHKINNSTSTISKVYNAGTLSGTSTNAFFNEVTYSQVTLSNSFNTVQTNATYQTKESNVVFTNVSDVNSNLDNVSTKTIDELKDKEYLTKTLLFNEYVDDPSTGEWIYESDYLPILYFDDLNNPVANLTVGTYNWQDLGFELKKVYFTDATAFQISSANNLNPIKEGGAYYYIHKSETPLTKQEMLTIEEWTPYESIVNLTEEGYYTIYVKALDTSDNTYYVNSELIVLDLNPPVATITMNDKKFSSFKDNLSNINVAEETKINITVEDKYSEVKELKYYISNIFLTEQELKDLDASLWQENAEITLNSKGTYVINVKTTDEFDHTAYFNTDYIVFGGFEETLNLGRESNTYDKLNITSNSLVTYNFSYQDQTKYEEGLKNNLITNVLLPKNTKLTLINNNTNEVYTYIVPNSEDNYNYQTNNYATYPLDLFTRVGQTDNTKVFDHKTFINEATKNISILFDFKNAEISNNFTLNTYLEMRNTNEVILTTLKSTIKPVNVYKDNKLSLVLNKLNTTETISYHKTTVTEVDLESYINFSTVNNETIYDTTTNNKSLGIAIKLVNSNNDIVSKKYLKNVLFQIGNTTYSPDNDGIVRINLSNQKQTNKLIIKTYETDTKLETGNYNFVITPFLASDGKYSSDLSATSITLPVTTTKTEEIDYGFNVTIDENDKVLYKKQNTHNVNLKIIKDTTFTPTVRVSLYKKAELTAYNQVYNIINLQEVVSNELTEVEENIYTVDSTSLDLDFNLTKLEKTGYELRFELYDGSKFITVMKKRFIVR